MTQSPHPPPAPGPVEHADAWAATRAETALNIQLQSSAEEYLSESKDIGRQLGNDQRELFVSCDPAEAMQQQFDHLQPAFIALHDLGSSLSRKLLAGVAAAVGRRVQRLLIRRQGYGTTLATLEFIDFPNGANTPLRIYATQADADTSARNELSRVLLGYSRLGAIMVGEMPPHLLMSSLAALRESMLGNSWHNRHLLLMPMSASLAIGNHGTEMGRGTGVNVRTTPSVLRSSDAWTFISGSWNRLRDQINPGSSGALPALPGSSAVVPVSSPMPLPPSPPRASAPVPLGMRPMPEVREEIDGIPPSPLDRYVNQLTQLTGMVSVAIFDVSTGEPVLHAGARPSGDDLGEHGAALLAAMASASRTLGLGHALPEAAITLGTHHLLLRGVAHHPGLALHAVLDKTHANLTLARLQIARMDALLAMPA